MNPQAEHKSHLVAAIAVLALLCPVSAKTIYVDDDAAGANNGTSWTNAYLYLQDALADANASEKPVEIRIAQGTYRPDQGANQTPRDRETTFQLISGVAIKGGYAGPDVNDVNAVPIDPNTREVGCFETILSGDIGTQHDAYDNSYHVVTASGTDSSAILDSITIRGGRADSSVEPRPSVPLGCSDLYDVHPFVSAHQCGGGMYNYLGSPTVRCCKFTHSVARCGGGLYNESADVTLVDCTFTDNSATAGGAIYNCLTDCTLAGCRFLNNGGGSGGAIRSQVSSLGAVNCHFTNNYAEAGGAMSIWGGNATLRNCSFEGNRAHGGMQHADGGGIYFLPASDEVCGSCESQGITLTYCIFKANYANRYGGGFYGYAELRECIFHSNEALAGGGIWGGGTLDNCIITNNRANCTGGGIYGSGSFVNCVFAVNAAGAAGGLYYDAGETTLANCVFAGNSAGIGGGMCHQREPTSPLQPWPVAVLANCTFAGNVATSTYSPGSPRSLSDRLPCGAGIHNEATIRLSNCVLWGNSNTEGSAQCAQICSPQSASSWPWQLESSAPINYSCIQGWTGELGGHGNIASDPCFTDPRCWDPNGTPEDANDDFWVNGDYHLKSQAGRWDPNSQTWVQDNVTSPCIDAGDPMSPIGYEPFPNAGIINMGAYGGTAEASKSYFGEPVCQTIVAGDINGDCKVNFADFALMSAHWLDER